MHRGKLILLALLTVGPVIGAYLLRPLRIAESDRPQAAVDGYLRATYARDFAQAYDYLSSADRRLSTRRDFVHNQGEYSGFTLKVARQLAGFMQIWLMDRQESGGRLIIKVGYRVPAPAELNDLLLNWDEDRLNILSTNKQKALLAELDARHKNGKLINLEGQETVDLIEESQGWKIFLDWAAGTRVRLQSKLPSDNKLEARFATTEVIAKNDELFLVNVTIKNPSPRTVAFTVKHLLDPPEVADDLQLVECGLLTPTTLEPQQEKEFATAYLLNSVAGQIPREIKLIYEFKPK